MWTRASLHVERKHRSGQKEEGRDEGKEKKGREKRREEGRS